MTIFEVQSLGYLYRRKDSYEHNRIDRSFGTGQILTKEEWIHVIEDDSEEIVNMLQKRHVLWVMRIMERNICTWFDRIYKLL